MRQRQAVRRSHTRSAICCVGGILVVLTGYDSVRGAWRFVVFDIVVAIVYAAVIGYALRSHARTVRAEQAVLDELHCTRVDTLTAVRADLDRMRAEYGESGLHVHIDLLRDLHADQEPVPGFFTLLQYYDTRKDHP